jgi:dTDP-6-deoxy-L-talose 4-dehydrogenase (NAD+)
MKTIHLLGSDGFIGRALQRVADPLSLHCWSHRQSAANHHFDLLDTASWESLLSYHPTHVILLSWPGLPNYQETFHVTRNLPACIALVEQLIAAGLKRIVVAGTCYEYGLQSGPLREDQYTDPANCYAVAKDSLRRVMANRCEMKGVEWCWSRIFYPYGVGQNPHSLLPSLQRAIEQGESVFAMSSGRQLRDFLAVDDVAQCLLRLINHPQAQGIYNCGSGQPMSIRELAERQIAESSAQISLKFGVYPDRADEPLAFWADPTKLSSLS